MICLLLFIVLSCTTLIIGQYFPQYPQQQQYYQSPNQQNFYPYSQTVHQPQQQQYQYNGLIQQKQQGIYQNSGIQQYNKVYYPQQFQQQMISPSIQNYQPSQILKNSQPYQSQYQQQVFQPQYQQQQYRQQIIQQPFTQYSQQPYQNNVMKQSSMPQVYQYNSQQNQQQYQLQNVNSNIGPIQISSDVEMNERIPQQQYNNPQQSLSQYKYNNIPTISPPTYRSNTIVKVNEKISSSQYQGNTYNQEGSFSNSADVPPPPPPEKFLPEKTITQKVRIASETRKGTNFSPSNFHALDERKEILNNNNQKFENNIKHDNIQIQSLDGNKITTQQPPIVSVVEEKNIINERTVIPKTQLSHLSPSTDSTTVNDVFLKCCHKKNVSPKCESRCNFDIINKKILTAMFLGSDPCPQSYGRDLFSCAAQDNDHTDCCRKMNVTRTTAGEKCLAFCKMTPDTHFQADVTYLPCWSVLNDIKQCFKNAIIDSL